MSSECVDPSALAAWCSGRLASGQRSALERHVDGCPECRELMAAAGRVCASAASGSVALAPNEIAGVDLLAMSELLDDALGPYRVVDVLGGGGLGLVFAAYDERLQRRVAIKAMRRPDGDDAKASIRREAKALATLSHAGIVEVFDVIERAGRHYMVMELVSGSTLRRWQDGRSRSEIVAAYATVGRALQAVHDAGLIHCDVKPDNVLVADDGRVLLADFGLALLADPDTQRDHPPGGTPRYMAPEQRRTGVLTTAADQYGFCVALWEAVAGELPPRRASALPRWLRGPLERGLDETPGARWPSMDALCAALRPGRMRPIGLAAAALGTGVVALALALTPAASSPPPAADAAAEAEVEVPLSEEARVGTAIAQAETARAAGDLAAAYSILDAAAQHDELSLAARLTLDLERSRTLDRAGVRDQAVSLLTRLEAECGDAPDLIRARIALEMTKQRPVSVESGDAAEWLREAGARMTRAGLDPDNDIETRRVAADLQNRSGKPQKFAAELDAAVELIDERTPLMRSAELLVHWGEGLNRSGRKEEAIKALERAQTVIEAGGLGRSDIAFEMLITRGNVFGRAGRRPEGIRVLERAVALGQQIRGVSPIQLGGALNDLGAFRMMENETTSALVAMQRAEALLPEFYGIQANLAIYYGKRPCRGVDDHDACVKDSEEKGYAYQVHAYELAREQLPADHPSLAQMTGNLAHSYMERGELKLANERFEEALAGLSAGYGGTHTHVLRPLLGSIETNVRLGHKEVVERKVDWLAGLRDANAKVLGPVAVAVVDYVIAGAREWVGVAQPEDMRRRREALAVFGPKVPDDIRLIDAWFKGG